MEILICIEFHVDLLMRVFYVVRRNGKELRCTQVSQLIDLRQYFLDQRRYLSTIFFGVGNSQSKQSGKHLAYVMVFVLREIY